MHNVVRRRSTFFAGFLLLAAACSSSTDATPAAGGKKTCADLQKCCDSASEPTKTGCNAATAAKNEDLCATSYDKMCGGGGDGGAGDGGFPEEAKTQCSAYCAKLGALSCGPSDCAKTCTESYTEAKAKSCTSEWTAATSCYGGATFTCNGDAVSTTDCLNEGVALATCTK
jgi:hypothetical protein